MASATTNYKRPWSNDDAHMRSPQADSAGSFPYQPGEKYGAEHPLPKPETTLPEQPINFRHLRESRPISASGDAFTALKEGRPTISATRDPFGSDYERYLSSQRSPERIGRGGNMESPWHAKKESARGSTTMHGETPPNKMMKFSADHETSRSREYSKTFSDNDGAYDEQGPRRVPQVHIGPTPFDPIPASAQRPRDLTGLINAGRYGASPKPCNVCEKANCVAPQLAKGLQRLHDQLKFVLARGKSFSAEVSSPSSYLATYC